MKRDESNTSVISDIVKKKRITFLKSASLFAEEDEIFGTKRQEEKDSFSSIANLNNHS